MLPKKILKIFMATFVCANFMVSCKIDSGVSGQPPSVSTELTDLFETWEINRFGFGVMHLKLREGGTGTNTYDFVQATDPTHGCIVTMSISGDGNSGILRALDARLKGSGIWGSGSTPDAMCKIEWLHLNPDTLIREPRTYNYTIVNDQLQLTDQYYFVTTTFMLITN